MIRSSISMPLTAIFSPFREAWPLRDRFASIKDLPLAVNSTERSASPSMFFPFGDSCSNCWILSCFTAKMILN